MKMTSLLRNSAILACLVPIAACADMRFGEKPGSTAAAQYDVTSAAKSTAFDRKLAQDYVAFANQEAREGDRTSGEIFAGKARNAAAGNVTLPESTSDWNIPADKRAELDQARATLVAALDGGARERLPEPAAHVQALYDCWVEEQSHAPQELPEQTADVAKCRNDFSAQIGQLQTRPTAAVAPAPAPVKPEAQVYLVFFDFDQSDISPVAERTLDQALTDFRSASSVAFDVRGFTDAAGDTDYNVRLSQRRAASVKRWLLQHQIAASQITTEAYGETQQRVQTADGVRNSENRRDEIRLSH